MYFRLLATAFVAVFHWHAATAATYDLTGIMFETEDRQSIFAPGAAAEVGTENVNNPAWDRYDQDVEEYGAALKQYESDNVDFLAERVRDLNFLEQRFINEVERCLRSICALTGIGDIIKSNNRTLNSLSPPPPAPIAPIAPDQNRDPLSGQIFLGDTWEDNSLSVGGFVGGLETVTLPNPALADYATKMTAYAAKYAAYQVNLGLYKACPAFCGKRPRPPKEPTQPPTTIQATVDLTTGAEASLETSGRAGVQINYQLDSGSFGAEVNYDIAAAIPDADQIEFGQAFSIDGTSIFTDGLLDTQSPTLSASIDAIIQAEVAVEGSACIVGACTAGSGSFDFDIDAQLLNIDAGGVTYFGGILPDGVETTTPGGSREFEALFRGPEGPLGPGALIIETTVPNATGVGAKVGESLKVEAQSDFIDINVDLDQLLGFVSGGLLPTGGSLARKFGPIDAELKIFDLLAGPNISVLQNFDLTPTLMVDFEFDRDVEIFGDLVRSFRGAWDDLPDFTIFGETIFSPVFSVVGKLSSVTQLSTLMELTGDFISVELEFGKALSKVETDPLFSFGIESEAFVFSLFDREFDVAGFSTYTAPSFFVGGDTLYVPTPEEPTSEVPLPNGLALMATGLVCFGWTRRRRGVQPKQGTQQS